MVHIQNRFTKMEFRLLITLSILTTIVIYSAEGARGGARGGARVRGGSTSVRSGGTFGVRSRYSGPRYSSGSWKTAAAIGTLYGLSSYKRRRLYLDNPDKEPTICFNEEDMRNETYGYFICPEDFEKDSFSNCCGDDDAQYCCEGLSGATIGAIVGGIIGGLALVGIIVCVVMVLKNRGLRSKRTAVPTQSWSSHTASTAQYTVPNATAPSQPTGFSNVYSTPYSGFPEQTDGQKAPIGFEGAVSPPLDAPPPYPEHGTF